MAVEVETAQTAGDAGRDGPLWLRRVTRFELLAAAVVALAMAILVVVEPDVLEAPFASTRAVLFTFGGGALAAAVYVAMLRLRVLPVLRVLAVGLPFVAVTYWLVEPYFVDDKVNDEFVTSIGDASGSRAPAGTPTTQPTPGSADPVLLGSGTFRGLAGHDGTGDAGFFSLPDSKRVLRFENFDIENGPDLRLYVVRGADQTDPASDSLYLGKLRGNVGNQTYDLPADFTLSPGAWTVLIWCEAFSVEFVAATVNVT